MKKQKNDKKTDNLINKFLIKNRLNYNIAKGIDLRLLLNYRFQVHLDKILGSTNRKAHRVILGTNLKVDTKKENYEVKSNTRLRYTYNSVENKSEEYRGILLNSNTTSKISIGDVKLEPKLKITSYNRINKSIFFPLIIPELKGKKKLENKLNLVGYSVINGKLKASYDLDKLSFSSEILNKLAILYATELDKGEKVSFNEIVNRFKLSGEIGYKYNETLKPIFGLGISHIYTNAQEKRVYTTEEFEEKFETAIEKYDGTKDESLTKVLTELNKDLDISEEKYLDSKHSIKINPSFRVETSLLNDKLKIEPKLEAIVRFGNDLKSMEKVGFKKLEGKITLNMKYMW